MKLDIELYQENQAGFSKHLRHRISAIYAETRVWLSFWRAIALITILFTLTAGLTPTHALAASLTDTTPALESVYNYRTPSRDGIGKIYMGREIATVMGHRGAFWLERPSREQEERPQRIIDALELRPNQIIADIGAGTGYMTFRLASAVPDGIVFAVDIQPEMLDIIEFLKDENDVTNVEMVLAEADNPKLPEGIDVVLMVDAYHEFEYPREVMTAIVDAIKPGGQVVLAEYRAENPLIPIKRLHKMTQRQVRREMGAVGLEWVKTDSTLPRQHLMFFTKPLQ
jgi:precorrin-6B methylase 2